MFQPALGYHQLVSYNHNHDIKYNADFHLLQGVFFTCSNTTPTITIFVPLLFDKALSMLKHIMEIVKGNTELSKLIKPPVLGLLNVWDHFSVHYWLNLVREDD